MAANESYPDDLKYHKEHDWARIEGDEAVLGITWFAQDALGELVHYEAPDVGSIVSKDSSYGEVESVKAVSDLISPLSGEVLEVSRGVECRIERYPLGVVAAITDTSGWRAASTSRSTLSSGRATTMRSPMKRWSRPFPVCRACASFVLAMRSNTTT